VPPGVQELHIGGAVVFLAEMLNHQSSVTMPPRAHRLRLLANDGMGCTFGSHSGESITTLTEVLRQARLNGSGWLAKSDGNCAVAACS
jgi:hypothetical protein